MMNHQSPSRSPAQPQRRIVFVSSDSEPLLSDAIFTALDDEVIFVESTAQAYSSIKRVAPDLIILCLTDEDVEGCRVLSMLALDSGTSGIPVLTYLTPARCRTAGCGPSIDREREDFSEYGSAFWN